jgi:hypothetical protein
MLGFLEYFRQKNLRKYWRLFAKTTASFFQTFDRNIGF